MSKATTKHATATRNFNLADRGIPSGGVILDMPVNQFNDLSAEGVDLVREATDAEVRHAKGEPAPTAVRETPKRARKPSARKPAPAPAPAADPVPPAPAEGDAA